MIMNNDLKSRERRRMINYIVRATRREMERLPMKELIKYYKQAVEFVKSRRKEEK